jgi:DNA-binding transcriptional regulator GbsR (MarR family)
MKLSEAKSKYIETWGSLATQWGINRTMAQIHALLLISTKPLSAEEVMEFLQVSRGNANMNIRSLIEWGLIEKNLIPGERREFFSAKKDIWELFKQITKERRKREIEPVILILEELKKLDDKTAEGKEFKKVVTDISDVTKKLNKIIDLAIKSDEHWLMGKMTDLIK